jgi:hypothetical protein
MDEVTQGYTVSNPIIIVHYATSWKVAGSRPDTINEFFQFT